MGKAKKKKRSTISRAEALRRINSMIKTIETDLKIALWDEAVLENGNNAVHDLPNKNVHGGAAYIVIHQSLAANLSFTLTRLYDFGSKRYKINKRETSSIPMLINLIKQKRCRDYYIEGARSWNSPIRRSERDAQACEKALENGISAYRKLMTGAGPSTLKRMQHFRNYRLAHRKIDDIDGGFPNYADLFRLIEPAVLIVENLRLATSGENLSLAEQRLTMAEEAQAFWQRALHPISN